MPTPELSNLSNLEARIIKAIDHCGWYADLWFPIVPRDMMDFAPDNPEEEVHAAFVGLIRRGLLVENIPPHPPGGIDIKAGDWEPTPEALAAAIALVR